MRPTMRQPHCAVATNLCFCGIDVIGVAPSWSARGRNCQNGCRGLEFSDHTAIGEQETHSAVIMATHFLPATQVTRDLG